MLNLSSLKSLRFAWLAALLCLLTQLLMVSAQSTPTEDLRQLAGSINIAGSSTVAPITMRMAEQFRRAGFTGDIANTVLGTGGGFDRFCADAVSDISNASRPINEKETERCLENGRIPVGFQVGIDALVVAVSARNRFVETLSMAQLAEIFSGRAVLWSDVDPGWPSEPIHLFSPGTDSGTFDYFVEEVFDNDARAIMSVPGIQFSEDDRLLVSAIERNQYAIGYFGYAYYYPERNRLKAVAIDGITPEQETAQSGNYPLSRPLYIYTAPAVLEQKPQVAAFIRYYLDNVAAELGTAAGQVGYFPVSDAQRMRNLQALRTITGD